MQYQGDTHEIRLLVKNYTIVPGLVLATIGGYMAFTGAFSLLWNAWLYWLLFGRSADSWIANLGAYASMLLPYVLFVIVLLVVVRYYQRRFGQAKPRKEEMVKLAIELVVAFVTYIFIGQQFDVHFRLAVSTALLIVALFLLVHWWMFARRQMHYLVLAALAMILSVVPLLSSSVYYWLYIKDTAPDWYSLNIEVCAGLLLFCAGLLDHWRLVRHFARVRSNLRERLLAGLELPDTQTEM